MMGFFSWCCAKCGQPVLSCQAVDSDSRHLSEAVVLTKRRVIKGTYDGYGRVNDYEIPCGEDPVMIHNCCYEGEIFGDLPESPSDEGQGFFHSREKIQAMSEAVWRYAESGVHKVKLKSNGS